jgi:hypothetical protein
MENDEIREASKGGPARELANDVAMLFSWAKVENASYRDFSRSPAASRSLSNRAEAANGKGIEARDTGEQGGGPEAASTPAPDAPAALRPPLNSFSGLERMPAGTAQARPRSLFQETSLTGRESPVIGVYSVAGGVGKTTLCANLGKTLCSLGEQILLVEASGRGLLSFYFGATEAKTGVRRFAAAGTDASFIQLIVPERVSHQWLDGEVKPRMANPQRTIFDLGPLCDGLLPLIFSLCTVVLVPLLPDLNSIVTVAGIESSLAQQSAGSKTPAVYYLFNRFNEHSANDLHAWDFVERQCGPRLLPLTLRPDQELSGALQASITSSDHIPGPDLSQDYLDLALLVRKISPLRSAALLPRLWREQ